MLQPRTNALGLAIDSMGNPGVAAYQVPITGYNTVLAYWRPGWASAVTVTDSNDVQNDSVSLNLAFEGTSPRVAGMLSRDLTSTALYATTYTASPDDGTTWNAIITLDADTQLLRDTARRMIETLAHPLNQARLSPDGRQVVRGYTIIQPSVSASLPSATATWFSRIFADPRGIDPYTHAVSDIYQDLVGEGSYHGKGIYELQTFHRLLSGRFPTAHLLSHDLLEGCHVRVGLATDIELLDVFPNSYIAWWSRQHRWIRGDWQIIDWLKSRVPLGDGRMEPNPLSVFNRWKIFDNLRRSLVPPATVALLLVGWFFTPAPMLWSGIIARSDVVAGPECFPRPVVPSAAAGNEILARPARPAPARHAHGYFSGGLCGHGARCHCSRHLPANDVASVAPGMGDGGRRSPAREKSATAIYSQPALDSRCLRTSFSSERRRREPRRW